MDALALDFSQTRLSRHNLVRPSQWHSTWIAFTSSSWQNLHNSSSSRPRVLICLLGLQWPISPVKSQQFCQLRLSSLKQNFWPVTQWIMPQFLGLIICPFLYSKVVDAPSMANMSTTLLMWIPVCPGTQAMVSLLALLAHLVVIPKWFWSCIGKILMLQL